MSVEFSIEEDLEVFCARVEKLEKATKDLFKTPSASSKRNYIWRTDSFL